MRIRRARESEFPGCLRVVYESARPRQRQITFFNRHIEGNPSLNGRLILIEQSHAVDSWSVSVAVRCLKPDRLCGCGRFIGIFDAVLAGAAFNLVGLSVSPGSNISTSSRYSAGFSESWIGSPTWRVSRIRSRRAMNFSRSSMVGTKLGYRAQLFHAGPQDVRHVKTVPFPNGDVNANGCRFVNRAIVWTLSPRC